MIFKNNTDYKAKRGDILFFIFIFLLQFIFIFQGLDLSDEGFLATFYAQIFNNPQSVQFGFLFWFTGIIGGLFEKLFPESGLWGLRLAGITVITFTAIITHRLLRNYINTNFLKFGLLIVVLTHNHALISINYNTLSALFYVCMAYLLFNGLKEENAGKIILSGGLIAVSSFARISNIMELGIILIIIVFNILYHRKFLETIKHISFLIIGFLVTGFLMYMLMLKLGHVHIFQDAIGFVSKLGKTDTNHQTGHNFYGFQIMVERFISNYIYAFKATVVFLALMLFLYILFNLGNATFKKWKNIILQLLVLVIIAFAVVKEYIHLYNPLFLFAGLIVLIGALILMKKGQNDLKLLSLFGIFFLFFFPFTSSAGIVTAGRFSFWIGLPIVFNYLFSFTRISNKFEFKEGKVLFNSQLELNASGLKPLKEVVAILFIMIGLYNTYYYPFFDKSNRTRMFSKIDNKYLHNIYTTSGRAQVMNELLRASQNYVRPGDDVIAYDRIPMYHYLTETKPFVSNPLMWLYEANELKLDLDKSVKLKGFLPVIVQQKISTVLESKSWPYDLPDKSYFTMDMNLGRNKVLEEFIAQNDYSIVWESDYFRIFCPASKK